VTINDRGLNDKLTGGLGGFGATAGVDVAPVGFDVEGALEEEEEGTCIPRLKPRFRLFLRRLRA
jgi:hypothetical protein